MNPVDEKIIIKKLKAGDNDAYKYLYDYHYVALCKLSYYMLKDKAQAESIVSDVIFHLWEIRENLELVPPLRNYLIIAVRNKCLNYLRHQQIHEEYSDKIKDYYEWELNTRIATLQACEPYELFISEIQELVQQTLTDMPEKTRTIFMLSRYENKSYKEIAVLMNITPKGVDFHINKALKMLQTNLKDYFPLFLYFFMKCH